MPSADNNFSLDLILHSEVQKLLDNFASVMRIHVMFYGPQGQVLRQGRSEGNCRFCPLMQNKFFSLERCLRLDQEKQALSRATGKCQSYLCHAHLWEAIMPVVSDGKLLGYVMFGQFRSTETLPPDLAEKARSKTELAELKKAFRDLPYLSAEGMENLIGLMELLVDYIVRRELITMGGDHLYRSIVRYIEDNMTSSLKISAVARRLGRSVSTISHFLQNRSAKSFKKLVIEKRLARAEQLLKERPGLSIGEVAELVGIQDRYYFSRLYKKYRGVTPGEFRRSR